MIPVVLGIFLVIIMILIPIAGSIMITYTVTRTITTDWIRASVGGGVLVGSFLVLGYLELLAMMVAFGR